MLLSFVLYTVMTIRISEWRKKFRAGQNKQERLSAAAALHDLPSLTSHSSFHSSLQSLQSMAWAGAAASGLACAVGGSGVIGDGTSPATRP